MSKNNYIPLQTSESNGESSSSHLYDNLESSSENPPSYEQIVGLSLDEKDSSNEKDSSSNKKNKPVINGNETIIIINENEIPRISMRMACPYCNNIIQTVIKYENNPLVWFLCIILSLFTMLCCIPFCINDLKDVVHYCPNCKREVARRERKLFA